MIIPKPSFKFEKLYTGIIAGIDEAGCGPWAGPVVAAAVIIDQSLFDDHLSQIHYRNPLHNLNDPLAQFIDRICTVNSVN